MTKTLSDGLERYFISHFDECRRRYFENVDDPSLGEMLAGRRTVEVSRIKKWLVNYRVLRGLKPALSDKVVDAIARTVLRDDNSDTSPDNARKLVLRSFEVLYGNIVDAVGPESEKQRLWLSMVSKLLWTRFPKLAPMYDRLTHTAITVLQWIEPSLSERPRLGNLKRYKYDSERDRQSVTEYYCRYCDLIWSLVDASSPVLVPRCSTNVPVLAPIRIVDKLLMMLGSDDKWPAQNIAAMSGTADGRIAVHSGE